MNELQKELFEEVANVMTNKILDGDDIFREPNGDINPQLIYDYILKKLLKACEIGEGNKVYE